MLDFFAGRETDVFVTPNGDMIPGVSLCDRVVTDCTGFAQLQFIQDKQDELRIMMVKGAKYNDRDMIRLDQVLYEYFKGKLSVKKIFVNNIPKDKSGKTRFCISNVPIT